MGNVRNLILLTILICSANALGQCACKCLTAGTAFLYSYERTGNKTECDALCLSNPAYGGRCTFDIFGIVEGTWEVIVSDNTPNCATECCFAGNVVIREVDGGTFGFYHQGSFSATNGREGCPSSKAGGTFTPWANSEVLPFVNFNADISGSSASLGTLIWFGYSEIEGKGTIYRKLTSTPITGTDQRLRCTAGPCLNNTNLYTSASTKKVVSYALVLMMILFITPSR